MKKVLKRTLATFLTVIMLFSALPLGVFAANESTVENETTAEIKQTNSLSKLLAESTDMSQVSMYSPYYISEMTFNANTANVRYYNEQDCWLVVAVYDENTEQMLDSSITLVYAESITADVKMNITLPNHFIAKAFLLDENNAPLCKNLTCRNYTTEYEKMAALTVDDFDSSKVVNLDDKKDNNFVVLSDDVVTIKGTGSKNVLYSSDVETNTYVIKNIDSTVKNLKAGDSFYLDNGDVDNFLAIKVKSISISGTTATIIAEDSDEEDLFECIKIDSLASAGQADYSSETADEAVEYEGEVNYETEEASFHTDSVDIDSVDFSLSHKFKIKEKEYKNKSGKVEGKFSGGVTFSAKIGFSAQFSGDYKEVSFTIDPSIKVEVKATGKIDILEIKLGSLDVTPVTGVFIGIEPQFVVKVSGSLSVSTELKFTLGVGYNSKDGFINKCKKPSLEAEIKAEVTLFIGFDLQPHVALLSKHVAKVTMSGEVGVEAKAILSKSSGTSLHFCSACVDGNLTGKLEISVKLTFGEDTMFEKEYKSNIANVSWKLDNFYYSISHNEFGLGSCPYILKSYVVKVTDSKGNPIKNAIVSSSMATDSGTYTNANGEATLTNSCGNIALKIEAYGYKKATRNVNISEDTNKFCVILKQLVPSDGTGSNDSVFTGTEATGTIINFGSYPQSKVTDSTLISKLDKEPKQWESYEYYTGTGTVDDGQMQPSDYMKYADFKYNGSKYRAVTFSQYRPWWTGEISSTSNTYQDDNGYYTGNVYYFKYEPLKWRVLDASEGLVMCNTSIDAQAYNNYMLYSNNEYYGDSSKSYYASDWANSSIREWLNEDFYNTAFSGSQQSRIKPTNLETKSTYSSEYDSANTTDNVFLLSYWDVLNTSYGFSSSYSTYDTAGQLKSTDYAKCQGCYSETTTSYFGNSWWHLRSPHSSVKAAYVDGDGDAYNYYYDYVSYTEHGVVPALKLEKSIIQKSPARSLKFAAAPKLAEKADGINITYSACKAGGEYILLNVLDYSEEFILSSDNLLYIDQLTADENGKVSKTFIPKLNDDSSTILLIGDFGNGIEARKINKIVPELKLSTDNVTLKVGESVTVIPSSIKPADITIVYNFSTENKKIATIASDNGIVITGAGAGETRIHVYLKNKVTGEILDEKFINVTVKSNGEVTGISVNDLSINYKDTAKLNLQIKMNGTAKYKVTYDILPSAKTVVTVSDNGEVYGYKKGVGYVDVTVTDELGNSFSDTAKVTVSYAWWQWIIKIVLFGFIWY